MENESGFMEVFGAHFEFGSGHFLFRRFYGDFLNKASSAGEMEGARMSGDIY